MVTSVKGGGGGVLVTIHCLINKICELGAYFLYFFLRVSSKWGVTSHPFHPLDLPLDGNSYTHRNYQQKDTMEK